MNITISFLTNREDPAFQWFADSLANQIPSGVFVEVLVIDLLSDYEPDSRSAYFHGCVKDRFSMKVIPPKPCAWQGKHRKTNEDMFAAANARNTAFIHATSDYIFCVDDLTVLSPQWLSNAIHAAQEGYVMCGAYKKLKQMVVKDGTIISHGEEILDRPSGL